MKEQRRLAAIVPVNFSAKSVVGQARRFELLTVTSDVPPYVERPLRQVLFSNDGATGTVRSYVRPLLARSKTAGLDEVRDASG